MKTINCFSFLIITLLLSCNTAEKWPTKRFIAKNNYQEVIGQVYSHAGKREKPDKFGMYPNGQKGIRIFKWPLNANLKGSSFSPRKANIV